MQVPALVDGIPVHSHAVHFARTARRLSLAEASRRSADHGASVSVSYLNDLERGARSVASRERLESLSGVFECDVRLLTTEPHLFDPAPAVA
jgi:transcriptional regulator with XRE-family HTH domain